MLASTTLHAQRPTVNLLVGDLILGFALGAEKLHRGLSVLVRASLQREL